MVLIKMKYVGNKVRCKGCGIRPSILENGECIDIYKISFPQEKYDFEFYLCEKCKGELRTVLDEKEN